MMAGLRARYDAFLGRGAAAVTIPAMDGALRANRRLDDGEVLRVVDAPDNLVATAAGVLYSSSDTVFRLSPGDPSDSVAAVFDAPVTCLAADAAGTLAVGLDDGRVLLHGASGQSSLQSGGTCPTALAFDGGSLVVAHGSAAHPPSRWRHDLMERGASGSVWRVGLDGGGPTCLARDLAWPCGVLVEAEGGVVVSESWRRRLLRLGARPNVLLDDLPGYPGRIVPAAGGAWLAVFAPRSQMVEFVLREPGYRRRMMAEIHEDYWMAPALVSGRSFLEPLQGGGVKHMATLNSWAPTRSYGLVVRLDGTFEPLGSWHSRADGLRHGVTSVVEHGGALLVASKGGNAILAVDPMAVDP